MKSHTVKSNAKRAARKLCEAFPEFMPATPVEAANGEWFPAVLPVKAGTAVPDEVAAEAVVRGVTTVPDLAADAGPYADADSKCPGCGEVPASERQEERPDLCRWCGYNHATGEAAGFKPASSGYDLDAMAAGSEPVVAADAFTAEELDGIAAAGPGDVIVQPHTPHTPFKSVAEARADFVANSHDALIEAAGNAATTDEAIELRMAAARAPDAPEAGRGSGLFMADNGKGGVTPAIKATPSKPVAVVGHHMGASAGAALAAIAATLPPPVKSSPEEIAARRAERLARPKAEPAAPAEPKVTRAEIIMGLVSQPEGETAEAIAAACDWQAHTLRGYIGGTLRKRLAGEGKTISAIREKGKPTRYKLEAIKKADAA